MSLMSDFGNILFPFRKFLFSFLSHRLKNRFSLCQLHNVLSLLYSLNNSYLIALKKSYLLKSLNTEKSAFYSPFLFC